MDPRDEPSTMILLNEPNSKMALMTYYLLYLQSASLSPSQRSFLQYTVINTETHN